MSATLDEQVAMVAEAVELQWVDGTQAADMLHEVCGVPEQMCPGLLLQEYARRHTTAVRAALLSLAHCCLNDLISDDTAAIELRLYAPHLDDQQRWAAFEWLMDTVAARDALLSGLTQWAEPICGECPECSAAAAQARVDTALDELTGGAS